MLTVLFWLAILFIVCSILFGLYAIADAVVEFVCWIWSVAIPHMAKYIRSHIAR